LRKVSYLKIISCLLYFKEMVPMHKYC